MPLTEVAIRNAKPVAGKVVKLSDGGGLQLWIRPTGTKSWNLAYRFAGKQLKLALGAYPAVSLKEARFRRNDAKELLAQGDDPGRERKRARRAFEAAKTNNFDAVAAELIAKKVREQRAAGTLKKLDWLIKQASPMIGTRPMTELTVTDILDVVRPIEARGKLETAGRLRALIGEVFRYAVATGKADRDITFDLRGALSTPKRQHRPAIVEPKAFGQLLRAIAGHDGMMEVRIALQLLALTFLRPGELRLARWEEFDLEAKVWTVPKERMKMRRLHRVPLAPQSIALLEEIRPLTGRSELVFPGARVSTRAISDNTLNAALRRLGYTQHQMTAHGFRASASSMLNESSLWNPDAIEAQLAHVESNSVRKAYLRAEFWDERVRIMNWWGDRLDQLRKNVNNS